jgi:hypothetical protein
MVGVVANYEGEKWGLKTGREINNWGYWETSAQRAGGGKRNVAVHFCNLY